MKKNEIKRIHILITNNCNLKCYACRFACSDNLNNNYFITEEKLKEQLLYIKNNITKSPISLTFTGGEALTHPNIIKLCEIARKEFPNTFFHIDTNGLSFEKILDKDLLFLTKELNIIFLLSLYPRLSFLKSYKNAYQRFKKLNLLDWFEIGKSHIYFFQQNKIPSFINENEDGTCLQNIQNKEEDILFFKENIYNCWNMLNIHRTCLQYPLINCQLANLSFNFKDKLNNKILCQYCRSLECSGYNFIFWHSRYELKKDYINWSLKDIYLNCYEDYYKLMFDCKEILECLKDSFFNKHFNLENNSDEYNDFFKRTKTGAADVVIPFNYELKKEIKEYLINQKDILKYNLYFVDYSQNKYIEEKNFQLFIFNHEEIGNIFFLKAKSLFDAYNEFFINSFLNKKIKITDLNLLKNENYLNELINK